MNFDKSKQNKKFDEYFQLKDGKFFLNLTNLDSQNQIKLLNNLLENSQKFANKTKQIVFVTENERLPKDVFIIINEPPNENWGLGGKQKG